MARIPDSELARLKAEISLQRLVETAGVQLKLHGQDLIGLCPFHDDKDPSLVITPAKNLWHCLGACQTGGSVIDWVMKREGISFRHAVELLRSQEFPVTGKPVASHPVKRSRAQKLDMPFSLDAEAQTLLMRVVDYYHATLKQSPEALAYLKQRGLDNPEVIDHFKLGFANRSLGYRLPAKSRKAGNDIRSQLQGLGIYRDSGHEHFSGSLVIPVINDNHVLEMYGRKITAKLRPGTPLHLYLPGPHQGVFNIAAFEASKEIILCESLIDALTFWCAGFRNVTASYGCDGFTEPHLNAFKDYQIERVLIAYDRDEAGDKASENMAKQFIEQGMDCYRIQFPKGMDANEYALSVKPANKSLGLVIRKAQWMGQGKASSEPTTSVEVDATPKDNDKLASDFVADLENVATTLDTKASLPATIMPELPKEAFDAQVSDKEVIINFGNRRYRMRGLKQNTSLNQLKVNVLVACDDLLYVDTFDFYHAKARAHFIKQAALELSVHEDIIKKDTGQVLLKLESLQAQQYNAAALPKESHIELSETETHAALALLKSPDLLQCILNDFEQCGVVGEKTNKLVGYLAAVSRKLDKPLAVLIQSSSAAGKSSLMDAVLRFMPKEEKVQYSAMTGQSLFYMGETNLKHKILAISEEEGASNATYALKLLQSEGELTIASTGKDETTGTLVTKEYHVEGPVMLFSTTTAIDIDEELLNRCLVLTVDEDRQQTKAIHDRQRFEETLEGLLTVQTRNDLVTLHQNAQRLLKPLKIVNPYAKHLTFLDDKTRTRRDHKKYLMLIRSITLLHQYQRNIKTANHNNAVIEYIEVTLDDIEIANQLAHEVLGRSLDELPPQTRKLLKRIYKMVNVYCQDQKIAHGDYHFSRKAVRHFTRWSDTALKVHLQRLVELEYVLIHRSARGQAFRYELLYDSDIDTPLHLNGLIDVADLKKSTYDVNRSGQTGSRSGVGQPLVRGQSEGGQGRQNTDNGFNHKDLDKKTRKNAKKAPLGKNNREPYRRSLSDTVARID